MNCVNKKNKCVHYVLLFNAILVFSCTLTFVQIFLVRLITLAMSTCS